MILGYFADIIYADTSREERWLTVDERNDLIGDGRVACATYIPLARFAGSWLHAPAWLIENISPGPYITTTQAGAMSAWQIGGTVTPLTLAKEGAPA